MADPSVLVACPTAQCKDYALESYMWAYNNFNYDNKKLCIVDNTDDGGEYWQKLKAAKIPCLHIDPTGDLYTDIDTSWQHILTVAKGLEVDYIFSLEIDILAPAPAIRVLLAVIEAHDAVMVRHAYPFRGTQGDTCSLGCTMFENGLVETVWDDVSARLDENGVVMHEERRFVQIAKQSRRPFFECYGLMTLEHQIESGVWAGHQMKHGHGIKISGFDGSS